MPKTKNKDDIEVEGMRAIGKKSIKIKIVNIPVKVFSGTEERESTHLKRVCPSCKGEVGNKYKCKNESCSKDLEFGEIKKGYRTPDKEIIDIDQDELEWLKGDMPNVIEGVKSVPLSEINPTFFLKPYFLCPENKSAVQPFEVFKRGLEMTGKALVCKFSLRNDVRFAVIYPKDDRLVAHTMRYDTEIRDITRIPKGDVPIDSESAGMMKKIIDSMGGKFAETELKDIREEKFQEFIVKKIAGETIDIPRAEVSMPDKDFAEQLKATLNGLENES